MGDYWHEKYDDLKWRYDNLRDKCEELEEKNNALRSELECANFKIRNDLEPRIEAERRTRKDRGRGLDWSHNKRLTISKN